MDIVAERLFERRDGVRVRAIVGRPRELESGWVCEFQILGVNHDEVCTLEGDDSLEAIQMALAMMVVQLESYQRDLGLTLQGDRDLGLIRPDFDAVKKEVKANPAYDDIRAILDEWDCAREFLHGSDRPAEERPAG